MKTEEALEKQIILDVDIETKESAVEALIETCVRNDELWKAIQECRRDLKGIKLLTEDIEILVRYKHDTDEIPIVTLISEPYSNERAIFEGYLAQVNDPNNIQWIYCMDYMGHVVLQSAVMGKVILATKSSEPYERTIIISGTSSSEDQGARNFAGFIPGTAQLMNPSGMFGHDTPGAIWIDPQGNYHEWHGGPYFVSNVPLKVKEPILSFADVDQELMQKVQRMEQKLRANGTLTPDELAYLATMGE